MGIDVEIRIGLKKKPSENDHIFITNLYNDCKVIDGDLGLFEKSMWTDSRLENPSQYEAIYEICSGTRYYGNHYERGPAISIIGTFVCLLALFQNYEPTIYYGGDCEDFLKEMNHSEYENLINHFVKNGNAPYRGTDYSQPITKKERL